MGGGYCSSRSRCQWQRLLGVVISLGEGERTLDRPLDAPLVRGIRRGVAAVELHPVTRCGSIRMEITDMAAYSASMDRGETKSALGDHLDRCRNVINHHNGDPVGAVDREGRRAITHA
jgi:hypothetical protein